MLVALGLEPDRFNPAKLRLWNDGTADITWNHARKTTVRIALQGIAFDRQTGRILNAADFHQPDREPEER